MSQHDDPGCCCVDCCIKRDKKVAPRDNRLPWHDCHMLQACIAAERSPDPNTQVGACIVDKQNRMVSTGYNGLVRGIEPSSVSWNREGAEENTKYPWVVHAERNAILNANKFLEDCTLYVTLFPCHECQKEIIQVGIKTVYYLENKYAHTWQSQISCQMGLMAGINLVQFNWNKMIADQVMNLLNHIPISSTSFNKE